MRIVEILLPKGTSDRSLSPQALRKIDALQQRMNAYVDKILNPKTSERGREFLKSRLRADYSDLRDAIPRTHKVAEAVHKLPLSDDDFKMVKELMERPIPAAVAPIYILEIIDDDELNSQLLELENSKPGLDVRSLIVEWLNRVMPDQMHRFTGDVQDYAQKNGVLSPIHGYDSHMYKGTNDPLTGDAYGSH